MTSIRKAKKAFKKSMKPKIMNEAEYAEFCSHEEERQVYDGRGTFDLYECDKCGGKIVTTYGNKGVTPFCMRCRHCNSGTMFHRHTFRTPPPAMSVKRWVIPSYIQYVKLKVGYIDHVNHGGLMLEEELPSSRR